MRGLWKPCLLYGGLALVPFALALPRGFPRDPVVLAFVGAMLLALPALVVVRSVLPPGRFVKGLAEAGEPVEVVEDEVGWTGDRRIVARGAMGEWRVESRNGKVPRYYARGPRARAKREVKGGLRKAAWAAVRETREGRAWPKQTVP